MARIRNPWTTAKISCGSQIIILKNSHFHHEENSRYRQSYKDLSLWWRGNLFLFFLFQKYGLKLDLFLYCVHLLGLRIGRISPRWRKNRTAREYFVILFDCNYLISCMEHWLFHSLFLLVWIFSNFSCKKIWRNLAGGGLQIAEMSLNDMHFLQFVFLTRAKIECAANRSRRKNFILIVSKNQAECQKFLSQSRALFRAKKTATK